jgi:hypothetical protein
MVLRDFNESNIIFVHVPKTGGGTIECIILEDYFKYSKDIDLKEERKKIFSLNKQWTQHHSITETISERRIYDPENYFKFAFVRNPWDRVVSEYLYMKNNAGCACRGNIRKIPKSFEEYVVGNFKCSWRNHVAEQYKFIYNSREELMVDFLGRFENFEEDLNKLLKKLGIQNRKNIPYVNQTRTPKQRIIKPYWMYYNKETKKIIEQKFEKDIKLFGYTFDEPEF